MSTWRLLPSLCCDPTPIPPPPTPLVAAGQIAPAEALIPILLGLATNTVTKLVLAASAGGRAYLLRVGPGLISVVLAIWAPVLLGVLR